MSSTMDKLKDKLHIRRKSQDISGAGEPHSHASDVQRESFDEELAAIPPEEREAYLKEYDEADKSGSHKQGGLIDKLIARGNKRTEDQLAQEARDREAMRAQQGHGGVIR